MVSRLPRALLLGLCLASSACQATAEVAGPSQPAGPARPACASPAACEQRAAAQLEAVRGDPAALGRFLGRFPKGADLHNHLAGAVYAESYLAWAREDGFRVDRTLTLVEASKCAAGPCSELPASPADPRFETILRAWSMKDFQPGAESGHDHSFASFNRFGPVSHEPKHEGPALAEDMRRTWEDGAIYLEVLLTVGAPVVVDIAKAAGDLDPKDLPAYERKLHADPRWGTFIATARAGLEEDDRQARATLHCGTPEAAPACGLTVRYLGQVGRTSTASQIFAESLALFEISAADPRVAGMNLVSPEDNERALEDYDLQMNVLRFLGDEFRGRSPLRITLHAGELTPALIPPAHRDWLGFHVRHAVEIARAERIGHGVDVLSETDAPGLLAEMRARGVTVEICLSSNAIILGVSGAAHPLSAYLAAGVPATLATDDPGVSRSSLTGEYTRAVTVQGLTYPQLKAMARRGLEAAFVPGASLWASLDTARPVDACPLSAAAGAARPAEACSLFLASSQRARLEWKLETQLAAFEAE
jgi:adenosine deaminase